MFNFPDLPPDANGMNVGQKVAIVTTRSDVEAAAATTLTPRGLKLKITRTLPIAEADVVFTMYFGEIEKI